MVKDAKLDFWIKNGLNVLFSGRHGVGKTATIVQAFDRAGLKWRYFSAATMDPWVDFIGVPRPSKNSTGAEYIELVRPKEFAEDDVEAIFFDEFNRSHKKVRNAVMELIQFRSINGKKFKNLKIIWAAINPDDDETYDVEKIDPAQLDRFHVHVAVDYKCSMEYFTEKYGAAIASAAISWWNELPPEIKDQVSPRRLDYALDLHKSDGDLRDVLPSKSNISKLLTVLSVGPIIKRLKTLFAGGNTKETSDFLSIENNFAASIQYILKQPKWLSYFLPLMDKEKVASLMAKEEVVFQEVLDKYQEPVYAKILVDFYNHSATRKQRSSINDRALLSDFLANLLAISKDNKMIAPAPPVTGKKPLPANIWMNKITANLSSRDMNQTPTRIKIFEEIEMHIPANLDANEALITLDLIEKLFKHSHSTTIKGKMKSVFGIINHCVGCLQKATGKTVTDLTEEHRRRWANIRRKIIAMGDQDKVTIHC